jgi:hypothetical protein
MELQAIGVRRYLGRRGLDLNASFDLGAFAKKFVGRSSGRLVRLCAGLGYSLFRRGDGRTLGRRILSQPLGGPAVGAAQAARSSL